MKVEDIIKLEQPPPKVLELLNEQVKDFDAVKWRDQATGTSTLHLAIEAGRLKLVKLLLEAGCEVNATDLEGCTPLCSARKIGRLDMVKVMVGHGADVHNATYNSLMDLSDGEEAWSVPVHGMTALACALLFRRMEVVAYLVKQGVRLNSTALALAIEADLITLKVRPHHTEENRPEYTAAYGSKVLHTTPTARAIKALPGSQNRQEFYSYLDRNVIHKAPGRANCSWIT
jgi:hypothetical protein